VFGHGPHVLRATELYKGHLICYSLGNFATFGKFNLDGPNGEGAMIVVSLLTTSDLRVTTTTLKQTKKAKLDAKGKLVSANVVGTKQNYTTIGPFLEEGAFSTIASLSSMVTCFLFCLNTKRASLVS
jgi:poly-gamma-glutamate capsule biosynthesis protein CapA/YwtB (metallophosphatase superfamily)